MITFHVFVIMHSHTSNKNMIGKFQICASHTPQKNAALWIFISNAVNHTISYEYLHNSQFPDCYNPTTRITSELYYFLTHPWTFPTYKTQTPEQKKKCHLCFSEGFANSNFSPAIKLKSIKIGMPLKCKADSLVINHDSLNPAHVLLDLQASCFHNAPFSEDHWNPECNPRQQFAQLVPPGKPSATLLPTLDIETLTRKISWDHIKASLSHKCMMFQRRLRT